MNKWKFIIGSICAVGILYWLAEYVHPFGLEAWMVKENFLRVFVAPVAGLFAHMILTPGFWIVVALTLTLELLFPAKPNQSVFSVSFAQDLVWFFYETVLHVIIILTYVHLITTVYNKNFKFLTIEAVLLWPDWARFVVGILLLDLMYWTQHFVNHKVSVLWSFHTVHHSQKELNFFTDFRYHVLEYIVRHTFLVIPFLLLQVDAPQIVWFAIFQRWYTRFYHGNIRTNLGFLRYVLVTPQSHRIHHSIECRHRDKNFGSMFSIWDQLFGTHYRGYDEYPETGIEDEDFPHERSAGIKDLLITPFKQMLYPFRRIQKKYAQSRSCRMTGADHPAVAGRRSEGEDVRK